MGSRIRVFRLTQTSMTLHDLERRNSPILRFFSPNSIALLANYVTVVEYRPIMSVIVCQFQPSTFGHNLLLPTPQRGLSAISELLFISGHDLLIWGRDHDCLCD